MVKKSSQRIIKIARRRIRSAKTSILGMDCSSVTVGWGLIVLNKDPTLVAYGHMKPLDSKFSEMVRLDDIYNRTCDLCKELAPTYMSVEDIFLFMRGKSKARTITLLTAFNRIISLAGFHNLHNDIKFYSVHEIRNIIKSAHPDIGKTIGKEMMPGIIRKYLEPLFSDIISKRGNVAKETFDEADGIAAAWSAAIDLNLNNK